MPDSQRHYPPSGPHEPFCNFNLLFEAAAEPHTYRIDTFLHPRFIRAVALPVVCELSLAEGRTIDPPGPGT